MFKSNEFHGSIRKTKVAGTCGVILAFAMMAMVANGNVSADEVKPISPATTEVAKPTTETAKPEAKAGETVKPVEAPNLDATVEKLKTLVSK